MMGSLRVDSAFSSGTVLRSSTASRATLEMAGKIRAPYNDPAALHEAALRMGVNLFVYAVTSRTGT
jgi:hypothetical protein